MITHLDRACIATLAPGIMRDLGLTTVQMGYVFTVFQLAYATFEIPTAWWADRTARALVLVAHRLVVVVPHGSHRRGDRAMSRCSSSGFSSACGEAGAWACVARTFSRWIPGRERGTTQGIFFAGAHLVGGLTPALVLWMLQVMTWRQIFVCSAGGLRVGRGLVHVVSERSVRAPRRQCRGAGDDRPGPRARGRHRRAGSTGARS